MSLGEEFAQIMIDSADEKSPWAAFTEQSSLWNPENLKKLAEKWKITVIGGQALGDASIIEVVKYYTSNPQPIGFSGILLAKRQNSFYCTYFLHNRNVADTKSPYPIKRLEVIRWFNQKSMVFNQSLS